MSLESDQTVGIQKYILSRHGILMCNAWLIYVLGSCIIEVNVEKQCIQKGYAENI